MNNPPSDISPAIAPFLNAPALEPDLTTLPVSVSEAIRSEMIWLHAYTQSVVDDDVTYQEKLRHQLDIRDCAPAGLSTSIAQYCDSSVQAEAQVARLLEDWIDEYQGNVDGSLDDVVFSTTRSRTIADRPLTVTFKLELESEDFVGDCFIAIEVKPRWDTIDDRHEQPGETL